MAKLIQPAFSRGEIAPALYGRVDANMYYLALRTARNVVVRADGGLGNRSGTMFVGPVAVHSLRPRLIPFQFKTTDTHIIEIGHTYIRIIRDDAHVVESSINLTAATKADPVEITTDGSHGYSTGDEVFLSGVGGMTEITEDRFLITVTGATTFTLQDQVDGTDIDGTGFTTYTSGGTAARIFTLTTDYDQADLRDIRFSQSADVMTLVHPSYPPRELRRLALDNWTLTDIEFRPQHTPPEGVSAARDGSSGSTSMKYKVTGINTDTDEESLAGLSGNTHTITAITKADPAVVTVSSSHGMDEGDEIEITGVVGMTEVNDRRFRVSAPSGADFELRDVDSTGFTTYDSGGEAEECFDEITDSLASNNASMSNTISWDVAADTRGYLVYRSEDGGRYSFVGETESDTFTDTDAITPNQQEGPPVEENPFLGAGNFPRAVGAFEQRRVFGGTDNDPDTSWFSKTGAFNNFSRAFPQRQDDSIKATLPAAQVNEIRHFTTLNDLLVMTSGAEWQTGSGDNVAFAFDTMHQKKQSNWGVSNLAPIVVGNVVLYVQEVNAMVRSLGFTFDVNGYRGNNLTLLVPHLVLGHEMLEWSFARFPDPVAYAVRDDGEVLVLTFEEEQEVIAWAHWDTAGKFESVAAIRPSVTETDDLAYFVVRRNIDGRQVRYIERTVPRRFEDVRDCFFVDCGLTHDAPFEIEDISEADPAVITITGHPFIDGDHVDIFDVKWQPAFDEDFSLVTPEHLNGGRYEVDNAASNTFELKSLETGDPIDGSAFADYVSGGTVRLAVNFLSGLKHLASTPVVALADGNVISGLTVAANGTLQLPRRFSRIHVGLRYVSDIETLNLESPAGGATAQGFLKKINNVTMRLDKSRGMLIGPTIDLLTEWKQREFEAWGEPTALFSGDARVSIEPDWNVNGRVFIRQKDPLPLTVLAVIPDIELEEEDD